MWHLALATELSLNPSRQSHTSMSVSLRSPCGSKPGGHSRSRDRIKLFLARPRGYCAGVEMAIECLDRALALYGAPLYVYHQIFHNSFIVGRYVEQGVVFVDDLLDVPHRATVIYSAHGVAPEIRRKAALRELNVIDATCPLVMKVHAEAKHFTDKGYR